jgi:predicted XRE-type DNA-binding protein
MNPSDIKAAIDRAGTSQTAIAEYLGIKTTAVNRVVQGKARSARVEAELLKICGKAVYATPSKAGRTKTTWNGAVA